MLESYVIGLVDKYIAPFAEVDAEEVKAGVRRGEICLSDVNLRTSAFDALEMPLSVKSGKAGELRVKMGLRNLRAAPSHIVLRNVDLVVGPAGNMASAAVRFVKNSGQWHIKCVITGSISSSIQTACDESGIRNEHFSRISSHERMRLWQRPGIPGFNSYRAQLDFTGDERERFLSSPATAEASAATRETAPPRCQHHQNMKCGAACHRS